MESMAEAVRVAAEGFRRDAEKMDPAVSLIKSRGRLLSTEPEEPRKVSVWVIEIAILILQVGCVVESMCRGNWWKALYWFGALLLTVAVVRGIKI